MTCDDMLWLDILVNGVRIASGAWNCCVWVVWYSWILFGGLIDGIGGSGSIVAVVIDSSSVCVINCFMHQWSTVCSWIFLRYIFCCCCCDWWLSFWISRISSSVMFFFQLECRLGDWSLVLWWLYLCASWHPLECGRSLLLGCPWEQFRCVSYLMHRVSRDVWRRWIWPTVCDLYGIW